MLETHIVMSSLIFRLVLTLMLCLVHLFMLCLISLMDLTIAHMVVDVLSVAPQAHGIVNVALYREYSPGIIFIFSQGRKDFYHVYNIGSNSNEYY
jgi:hypothetical protein